MAYSGRKDVRTHSPTASDIAEVASGRGSSADKREVGFVKRGGRLLPGPHSPRTLKSNFAAAKRSGSGGPTRMRTTAARARPSN